MNCLLDCCIEFNFYPKFPSEAGNFWNNPRTYIDAAYCYRPSRVSVGLSVCHISEPCKNGYTDRDAIWVEDSGGPKEPCIRWGPDSSMGRGNFEWGEGSPIVKYRVTAVICAKMAEPIEMPFWVVGSAVP